MNLYLLLGAGIVAGLLALVIRQYRAELGVAAELAAGLLLLSYAVVNLTPVLEELRGLADRTGLQTALLGVVLKALGVCWLTQFAADLCRDAGETAIAGKLTLAGKVLVTVLSLPLFREVLDTVIGLVRS